MAQKQVYKKTIGLGLERLVKRGNRMPIQVVEGKKRPDVPLQAAKLASETGVALRDQLPIFTSWKLYERDEGPTQVQKVLDKVAVRAISLQILSFLNLLPCTKLCLITHLCGCRQGWMCKLSMRDQAGLHALISLRGEYGSRGITSKGGTSTHHWQENNCWPSNLHRRWRKRSGPSW